MYRGIYHKHNIDVLNLNACLTSEIVNTESERDNIQL